MDLPLLVASAPALELPSARLVLRRFTAADIGLVTAQESDRALMRWIRDPEPADVVRARGEAMASPWLGRDGEWLAFTIVPHREQRAVGIVVCRLGTAANETMEIGYRLDASVHRCGYTLEACARLAAFLFEVVRVHKLVAWCVADNEPSWRLLEKLGMRREACLRQYTRLGGAWRDELVYGLLADEWRPPAP